MKKAIWSVGYKSLVFRVPKKRGQGFLVSAFGGHHSNKESRELERVISSIRSETKLHFGFSWSDVDGHVYIDVPYEKGEMLMEMLMPEITKIHPHIEGWERVSWNEFFS